MPTGQLATSPAALAAYIGTTVLASSDERVWRDAFVQIFDQVHVQDALMIPAVAEPVISWTISGSARVEEREVGGTWKSYEVREGDFYLTHSDAPYELRWRADKSRPFRAMHVYLSLARLAQAGHAVLGESNPDIRLNEVSCSRDDTVSALLEMIRRELLAPAPGGALLIDGVLSALAVHLVRHYVRTGHARIHKGLAAVRLRKAVLYMDEHLDEAFDLARLADEVGLSAFHFSRQFAAAAGMAPSRYFIARRMDKAKRLLRESELSIVDVALAVGYSNPSHFAQVFRRESGVAPSDYRHG